MLFNFIVSYLLYRLTYCRILLVIIIKSNYIMINIVRSNCYIRSWMKLIQMISCKQQLMFSSIFQHKYFCCSFRINICLTHAFNNILENLENFSKFYQKLRKEFHSSVEQYFLLEHNKTNSVELFVEMLIKVKGKS